MLIKKNTSIDIKAGAEDIWDFAHNPKNWTASNTEEHFGLKFDNKKNRPETGVTFHQKETVAGLFADLKGHIVYADKPNMLFWRGIATYKILGGLIRPRIPEGGLLQIKKKSNGTEISHDVYMDFPESLCGKLSYWAFKNIFKGEKTVYDHTYKELVYFKKELEKKNG